MRGVLLSALLLQRIVQVKDLSRQLGKLTACIAYLKTIKTLRSAALHFIGMVFCMMLFVSGMVVLHLTMLFYAPWPQPVRITVTMAFVFLYIFVSGGIFLFLLSQKTWMKLFYVDRLTDYAGERHLAGKP